MMTKFLSLALAIVLASLLIVPVNTAYAANMKMSVSSKTLYLNEDNKGGYSDTIDLSIKNKPSNYKSLYSFKWYASDNSIVNVDKGGVVTAKKVGTATVKCNVTKKKTGKLYQTLKCTITVRANAKTIVIRNAPEGGTLRVGDTFDFNRTMKAANGGAATDKTDWSVSDEMVGSIDKNGLFTAIAPGTVEVVAMAYQTASTRDLGYTAVSAPVKITVTQSPELLEQALSEVTEDEFDVPLDAPPPLNIEFLEDLTFHGDEDSESGGDVFVNVTVKVRRFTKSASASGITDAGDGAYSIPGGMDAVTFVDVINTGADAVTVQLNVGGVSYELRVMGGSHVRLIHVGRNADVSSIYAAYLTLGNEASRLMFLGMLSGEQLTALRALVAFDAGAVMPSGQGGVLALGMGGTIDVLGADFDKSTLREGDGFTLTGGQQTKGYGPSAPKGLVGVSPSEPDKSDGKIENTTTAMEYSSGADFADAVTCSAPATTGLSAGTYFVRYKETDTRLAGKAATVIITPVFAPVLTGTVTISGRKEYGYMQTATVSDTNNTGVLAYQWMRGEAAIPGATGTTYTTVAKDIGAELSCAVTSSVETGVISGSTDGMIAKASGVSEPSGLYGVPPSVLGASDGKIKGTTDKMEYSATKDFTSATDCLKGETTGLAAGTYYVRLRRTSTHMAGASVMVIVAPGAPAALTGTVTITGIEEYSRELTATVSGSNNTGTLAYQWKRGGAEIPGATGTTYATDEADIGNVLACVVSSSVETGTISGSTNGAIAKASGVSAPTGLRGVQPSALGLSDGKIEGTSLTMEYSGTTDFASAHQCSNGMTTGLAAGTYYVRYRETATHLAGAYAEVTVPSGASDALTGVVTITGIKEYGRELTATVSGSNNTGTLFYQWKRGGAEIPNATGAKYATVEADIGHVLACVVSSTVETGTISGSTDSAIAKASGVSAPTGLSGVQPSARGLSDGKITGTTTAMEYSASQTFTSASACASGETKGLAAGTYYVRCRETATHLAGAYVEVIVPPGPIPALTGVVTITGIEEYGCKLTATVSGSNNTGMLFYQWIRKGDVPISGATSASYTAAAEDIDVWLTCVVSSSVETGEISGRTVGAIRKASGVLAPTGLIGVQPSARGAADGKIMGTTTAMEYSTSQTFASASNCSNSETAGLAAGTYYVRYRPTATHFAGAYAEVIVPQGTPAELTGTVTISGIEEYGCELTATVSGSNNTGTLSYQWKRGDAVITGATSAKYTTVEADIWTSLTCVVSSSVETGVITGSISGEIDKVTKVSAPVDLTGMATSAFDASDGRIAGTTTAMEFSQTSDFSSATPCSSGATGGLSAGVYYVRYKETNTHYASSFTEVVVPPGGSGMPPVTQDP